MGPVVGHCDPLDCPRRLANRLFRDPGKSHHILGGILVGQIVNMGSVARWIRHHVVFQVHGNIDKLPGHGKFYFLFDDLRINWRYMPG